MNSEWIKELGRTVWIGSGAIGTCLRHATGMTDEPVELLNLRRPEAVGALHAAYRAAGSRILVTNTFAANAVSLGDAGAADACEAVNRAGVELARTAAGPDGLVWASIGPLGLGLRLDDYRAHDLLAVYRVQCAALRDADALLLETFTDLREAQAALLAAGETGLPLVFQIGNTGGGERRWERVDRLLEEAHRADVAAVGTNCHHPDEIVRVAGYIGARTRLPLTASPNAGHPRIDRGRVQFDFTPDDLAAVGKSLAAIGVSVMGGCCGTTPEHIRRLAEAVSNRPVAARAAGPVVVREAGAPPEAVEAGENAVRSLMRSSRFLVSVEIRADRALPLAEIVRGAGTVAAAGADLFDVPDNPGATVGRDAMVTAARLQEVLRIPAFCHMGVTQANLLRLHASLIGCWDLGLRGILAVTGDAPGMGHLGNLAHRVTDMRSSVELLRLIRALRGGTIINGEALADPPDFCAGCAVGRPIPAQIRWLRTKIEAGAEFVYSQPVFAWEDYQRLRDAVAGLPIRFFPGLMPLVSRRSAAFLAAGRIPGIVVPAEVAAVFDRYEKAEDQRKHGLEAAGQLAEQLAGESPGLYVIMPFGKRCYADTADLVRRVKAKRGPR